MDHKYKSLLQNIPTRHIIASIDDMTSIKLHLTRFRDVDIVNFFVLGKLSIIKSVLDHANSNKLFGRKYAWHVITQVTIINNSIRLKWLILNKLITRDMSVKMFLHLITKNKLNFCSNSICLLKL